MISDEMTFRGTVDRGITRGEFANRERGVSAVLDLDREVSARKIALERNRLSPIPEELKSSTRKTAIEGGAVVK